MNDERLEDPLLLAVRAARPAPPSGDESPHSPEARLVLERALASTPRTGGRPPRRVRPGGWAGRIVPALGVLMTVAIVVLALATLGHRQSRSPAPHGSAPAAVPSGSGLTGPLSAAQYAFAVGGDSSTHTSRTQVTSGLRLVRADQVLRERCMAQRGFHYVPDPTPTTSDLPSMTGYPSTFYPQPLASAYPESALLTLRKRDGFDVASSTRDPDPDDRYLKTLPPAERRLWLTAWSGHDGCYGTAEVELFGSRQAASLEQLLPSQIYNYLNSTVYTPKGAISRSNAATANAAAAWSRCMRTRTGRAWTDENALIVGLENNYTGPKARRLAVADTKCAYSSGQAQVFAAAFHHAAAHLPIKLQHELRYLLAHRHAWINRANRILASPAQ